MRLNGMRIKEIAKELGLSTSTIDTHLERARRAGYAPPGRVQKKRGVVVGLEGLTPLQMTILRALLKGVAVKQIAHTIVNGDSPLHYTYNQIRAIRRKLGTPTDIALGAAAVRLGLL